MKLNRYNYEEYFILYMDNELDSEGRSEVETFAQENPDLKAELDMLMQSKLTPDDDISFLDKDSLMRFHNSTISLSNYEEWLIAYIDNELSEEDRMDAERFIAGNPSIQRELNLLQRAKLQPEAIVFPYKESLYRKEEKASVIAFSWRRIAVAAVLLLAISTTAIVLINNKKDNGNIPVAKTPAEKKSTNNTTIQKTDVTLPMNSEAATARKKTEPIQQTNAIAVKQNAKQQEKKTEPVPVKNEEPGEVIANNNVETTHTNNLTRPNIISRYPANKIKPEESIAAVPNSEASLTKNKVTDEAPQPSYAVEQQSSGNKGIRGFLRKVTRTIEKRTNIKATDDDDRLLVAGLAIKL